MLLFGCLPITLFLLYPRPESCLLLGKLPSDFSSRCHGGERKRVFIGLLIASCLVLCLFLLLFLVVPWTLLQENAHWLPALSIGFGLIGICLLLWLCLGIVLHCYAGLALPAFSGVRHITVRLLFPLMELLAKFVGINRDRLRRSFITVNNEAVCAQQRKYRPSALLLLLPHCIQNSACPFRLVYDVDNCQRCGKCPVKDLLELRDKYAIQLAIATGGTIARRLVVEMKPKCIIAVACERDLTAGIQDSYPLPVFGVLNQRPHGPCLNTLVPLAAVEAVIQNFLEP